MGSISDKRHRTPANSPCPKCGREFSRKDSLQRHLKVHSQERGPLHRIVHEKFVSAVLL